MSCLPMAPMKKTGKTENKKIQSYEYIYNVCRPNLVSRLDIRAGTLSNTHLSLMYSVWILLHISLISYECFEHFSGSLNQHAKHQPGGGSHSEVIWTASGGIEFWFVREWSTSCDPESHTTSVSPLVTLLLSVSWIISASALTWH